MLPEHLELIRTPGRAAVHPGGAWAVVALHRPDLTANAYRGGIWRVSLPDGAVTPFTYGRHDSHPVFSADGRHLAFLRRDDDGADQLALLDLSAGEPRVLTEHPLGITGRPVFSGDSTRIAYTARVPEAGRYATAEAVPAGAESPRHITALSYRHDGVGFYLDRPLQVFLTDVPGRGGAVDAPEGSVADALEAPTGATIQVTTLERDHFDPVWTPEGNGLLVRRAVPDELATELIHHRAEPDSPAHVIDVQDLAAQHMAFGEDGATVWLLLTDLGPGQDDHIGKSPALYRADWHGDRTSISGLDRLTDPTTVGLTGQIEPYDGGVLLTRRHRGRIDVMRWHRGEATPVLTTDGEATGVCAVGQTAVVTASSPGSPGELYLVAAGRGRALTDFARPLRAASGVIEVQEATATAPDGYPVHGWVAVPHGAGPHPVLLLIHGGPHSHFTPAFFDEVQTYAAAGYAVVFCNPRGSAGYGQAHGRAITHAMGTKDAEDVLAFLDQALTDERLDGGRLGVMGGSYGGYLSAWLTTRTDRFAAAIVERGFLDPDSFVGSSDIGWYFPIAYVGTDPAQVRAQSPMAHLDHVLTPTLVIHSEQDWRCPIEQGQRWYTGLKRRGVPTELLLFPGEGHELSRSGRPTHRAQRFEHILTWWQRHLPVG